MSYAIGIDLGGTRIKGIVMDEKGNVLAQEYRPTNDGDDQGWKKAVADTVNLLRTKVKYDALPIGISAPGIPNHENTTIACMPGRLAGLEHFVWRDFLQTSAFVLNDGVAALLAEARSGAARGSVNAVMVTLGTGVGGALLIDGKPFQGSSNKAGHIGHTVVDSDVEADDTHMPGSLEVCIGNYNIKTRSGGRFSSTHELLDAYRRGEEEAKTIWLTSVRKLAIGLASASNLIAPDTIVVGGGIAEAGDDLFEPLNKWFDDYEWQPTGFRPKIVKAQHADLAGAVGAAFFALEKSAE